ncbi:MAG: ATP-dependent ligase [Glaciihabitans sp.]|nr:ATP-dependent ligase [Glaciihabitans sp.]
MTDGCERRRLDSWKDTPLGKLQYGNSGLEIEFDDRVLAHLQVVIGAKMRRREGFFFSWRDDPALGDGRSSIWVETSIPLFFRFATPGRHQLNREWLEQLTQSANQTQGLFLTTEPGEDAARPKSPV